VPLCGTLEPGLYRDGELTGGFRLGRCSLPIAHRYIRWTPGPGERIPIREQEVLRERRVSTRTRQGRDAHRSGGAGSSSHFLTRFPK
jgi:hypothetical protein